MPDLDVFGTVIQLLTGLNLAFSISRFRGGVNAYCEGVANKILLANSDFRILNDPAFKATTHARHQSNVLKVATARKVEELKQRGEWVMQSMAGSGVFLVTGFYGLAALILYGAHEYSFITARAVESYLDLATFLLGTYQTKVFIESLDQTDGSIPVGSLQERGVEAFNSLGYAFIVAVLLAMLLTLNGPAGEFASLTAVMITTLLCTSFLLFFVRLLVFSWHIRRESKRVNPDYQPPPAPPEPPNSPAGSRGLL